jgi:ribosome biogenesis GTPase
MIKNFGWSDALAAGFAPYAARGFEPARVIVQQRGQYLVMAQAGEMSAQLAGRMIHDMVHEAATHPAVGDWVAVSARPVEGAATIHAVLARRTAFTRKAAGGEAPQIVAANVDVAFLVTSMNAELNPRRLERYLATAWASGAKPVVVLTKADLCADPANALAIAESVAFGAPVLAVSSTTGQGLDALSTWLKPRETCALVGSSGVGKSTLVNALAGRPLMETGAIREADAKGRHTTTHRQLLALPNGALVLDTPGMRELGLFEAEAGLSAVFEDVEALAASCKFTDCRHKSEPGCAIRGAIATGLLDPARLRSFEKLQRELAYAVRQNDHQAREAAHRRWVVITKAARAGRKMRDGA